MIVIFNSYVRVQSRKMYFPQNSEETIIEERHPKSGAVINKYAKGKYLGKVHAY